MFYCIQMRGEEEGEDGRMFYCIQMRGEEKGEDGRRRRKNENCDSETSSQRQKGEKNAVKLQKGKFIN